MSQNWNDQPKVKDYESLCILPLAKGHAIQLAVFKHKNGFKAIMLTVGNLFGSQSWYTTSGMALCKWMDATWKCIDKGQAFDFSHLPEIRDDFT